MEVIITYSCDGKPVESKQIVVTESSPQPTTSLKSVIFGSIVTLAALLFHGSEMF